MVVFSLAVVILLLPIWLCSVVATQDGPSHLSTAFVMSQLEGADSPETYTPYFERNSLWFPTWLVPTLLKDLSLFFAMPIAERLLLSAYVVSLPLAFWFAIRPLTESAALGALLVLPVVYNYNLNMGFYSFLLSMVMFLVVIGIWLRSQSRLTVPIFLSAALCSYLTFQMHPFSWVVLGATLGFLELVSYGSALRNSASLSDGCVNCGKIFGRRILLYVLTIAPGMIHTFIFLSLQEDPSGPTSSVYLYEKIGTFAAIAEQIGIRMVILTERIYSLAVLSGLVSYYLWETIFTGGFLGACIALGVCLNRQANRETETDPSNDWRRWQLVVPIVFWLLSYLVTKENMFGGGFVASRIQLFALLLCLMWVGSHQRLYRYRTAVVILTAVMTVFAATAQTFNFNRHASVVEAVQSLEDQLVPGRTITSLKLPEPQERQYVAFNLIPDPTLHVQSIFTYRKGMVDLGHYQGWRGYFPIRYRDHVDPQTHLCVDSKVLLVDRVELPDLKFTSPDVEVDFVLVIGAPADHAGHSESAELQRMMEQITRSFEKISHHNTRPELTLYRRTSLPPAKKREAKGVHEG